MPGVALIYERRGRHEAAREVPIPVIKEKEKMDPFHRKRTITEELENRFAGKDALLQGGTGCSFFGGSFLLTYNDLRVGKGYQE